LFETTLNAKHKRELRIGNEVIDALIPLADNREQLAVSARKNEFGGVQDLQAGHRQRADKIDCDDFRRIL